MLKITPKQADMVHRLVKVHRCVQLISIYGIYCNYFKEAVLPGNQELNAQIKKQNKLK